MVGLLCLTLKGRDASPKSKKIQKLSDFQGYVSQISCWIWPQDEHMHDSLLRKPIFIIQVQNFINKSQRNDIVCSLHMRFDLHWHNKLGKTRGGSDNT